MQKVTIFGGGLVGGAIARDLAGDYQIQVIDKNEQICKKLGQTKNIRCVSRDLANPSDLGSIVQDSNLVINALPGFLGFKTLERVISAGKNIVDISFFPEDPFDLALLAQEKKVTAIVDCGVAPGMSNIILGYHHERMQVDRYKCYVGGLPFERKYPYQYKAPFSPSDVLEEYTRPARIVENGEVIIKDALSEPELLEVEGVGTLEAFNTDGLRTLLSTMQMPFMQEKTLRYPGHRELMFVFRETGFLDKKSVKIGDQTIRPLDLTTQLLFPRWHLGPEEPEFTVMLIEISGTENQKQKKYSYTLFDQYNSITQTTSMARTTGYTCTAAARLVLTGKINQIGVIPPEYLGKSDQIFQYIMDYQADRGIHYKMTTMP